MRGALLGNLPVERNPPAGSSAMGISGCPMMSLVDDEAMADRQDGRRRVRGAAKPDHLAGSGQAIGVEIGAPHTRVPAEGTIGIVAAVGSRVASGS